MKKVGGLYASIVACYVLYHHLVQSKVAATTAIDVALVSNLNSVFLFEMLLPSLVMASGYGVITRFYDPRRTPWTLNRIGLYLLIGAAIGALQLLHLYYDHDGRFTLLSYWEVQGDLGAAKVIGTHFQVFCRTVGVVVSPLLGAAMGLGLSECVNVRGRRVPVTPPNDNARPDRKA